MTGSMSSRSALFAWCARVQQTNNDYQSLVERVSTALARARSSPAAETAAATRVNVFSFTDVRTELEPVKITLN